MRRWWSDQTYEFMLYWIDMRNSIDIKIVGKHIACFPTESPAGLRVHASMTKRGWFC